jgi:hypothetical protein
MRRARLVFVVATSVMAVSVWIGCGTEDGSVFGDQATGDDGGNGDVTTTTFGGDGAPVGDGGNCTGLACKKVVCPGGGTTSLSGTVVSPRPGDPDPIYNAIVYVPNAPVAPFTEGVSCDRCGAAVSGSPIAVAQTGIDGKFTLTDVPVSNDLPLVVQIGRWRRQVKVPVVASCADTKLAPDLTRLPRNHTEGDIPKTALKTGDSDSPECVLRKMGIDDAEFTAPGGGGRFELYRGILSSPPTLAAGVPDASVVLDDLTTMKKYDLVLLPCDGDVFAPDTPSMQNLQKYADLGGRIFASHYSYEWIKNAPSPPAWSTLVSWDPAPVLPPPGTVVPGVINTSFPKGAAMSQWLQQLGAADGGVIPQLWQPRRDVDAVVDGGGAIEWISEQTFGNVGHFSFNTPLGADAGDECGRVVFNDFHTVDVYGGQTGVFPAECTDKTQPLTSQERVFEFMLFDLSSCVQKDDQPPPPPPPPVR